MAKIKSPCDNRTYEQGNILIVDDLPDNLRLLEKILSGRGHNVWPTTSGMMALKAMKQRQPDLVILDIRMPEIDGFEVCKRIKANKLLCKIPVIFVSALTETEDKIKAFQAGGVDYITKPFQEAEVLVRVNTHLALKRLQQKTENDLQQTENKYQQIYNAANEAILICDARSSHIKDVNLAALEMTGYSSEEIKKLKPGDLSQGTSPYSQKEVMRFFKLAVTEGPQTFEWLVRHKNNETFWVEVTLKKSIIAKNEAMVLVVRNIRERKEAEKGRKKLEGQLQQAQKMEAIGTLAGGIAHDFNNILGAILGYGEIVIDELPEDSPIREDQQQVLDAGNRAKDLVKQILAFSRKTELEFQHLKLHHIIKEAIKLLRASLPTTINIEQEINSDCGFVFADPTQIHQVIMNLCTNAYHAMRETGGTLSVVLKEVEIGTAEKSLRLHPGRHVLIEISDTGCGMDTLTLEKIFDPYFTTKGKGEGTGLGLAVVHGIVKTHGGQTTVQSEPGQGTTFQLYFPRVESEEKIQPDAVKDLLGGNERILLVDDDATLVNVLKRMLEKLGYRTSTFSKSPDALEEFKKSPEVYDLVITDMIMPQMTGADLAREILQITPDMPIILCTGFNDLINEEKAKSIGISKYVMKPVVQKDIAVTVRTVLDNAIVRGARILLIDDVQFNVELGRHLLEELGCEVNGLTNSQEALELFRADPDKFDLIITAQEMPIMTGFDLAREARMVRPDIPVLILSGTGERVDTEEAKLAGIQEFLMKPLEKGSLLKAIRRVLS